VATSGYSERYARLQVIRRSARSNTATPVSSVSIASFQPLSRTSARARATRVASSHSSTATKSSAPEIPCKAKSRFEPGPSVPPKTSTESVTNTTVASTPMARRSQREPASRARRLSGSGREIWIVSGAGVME